MEKRLKLAVGVLAPLMLPFVVVAMGAGLFFMRASFRNLETEMEGG